ncbi:MAG: phenol hydroxylase subunit [Candidatus Eiseniibacteriota bacterium]
MFVPEQGDRTARVLGVRRGRFVEFRFALGGNDDLAVELVMPLPQLLEFCRQQNVRLIAPGAGEAPAFAALCRAEGVDIGQSQNSSTGGASREH